MTTRSSDFTPLAVGAQQPATIDPTLDLCPRYPLWLGGPRQCAIRSFPGTSTRGQHWKSNPRSLDLESNMPYPPGHILVISSIYNGIKQMVESSAKEHL